MTLIQENIKKGGANGGPRSEIFKSVKSAHMKPSLFPRQTHLTLQVFSIFDYDFQGYVFLTLATHHSFIKILERENFRFGTLLKVYLESKKFKIK